MIEDDINYSIKISCFPWLLLFITRCEWNRDCLIVRLNGVVNGFQKLFLATTLILIKGSIFLLELLFCYSLLLLMFL